MPVRTDFIPAQAHKILKKNRMFTNFSDPELLSLLEKTNAYTFKKGETIFLEDDESKYMYVILKGRLKVVETTQGGLERVMSIRHRGECIGDMVVLDGKPDPALFIAMESCKMLLVSKSLFEEFSLNNTKVLQGIVQMLCGRLRECWLFHNIVASHDVVTKIRVTLAQYSRTLGIEDSTGVIIDSSLSHQTLADRVHVSRETVTRVLSKIKDDHEIEVIDGRRIKLLPKFFHTVSRSELYKTLATNENGHKKPS